MHGLMAAIRAMLASVRSVWVKAVDGMGWVLTRVVDTALGAGGGGQAIDPVVEHVTGPAPDERCEAIRQLAVAILGGQDTPDMYARIGDRDGNWLAVVSRIGLARIACASNLTIQAHLSGGQSIRGVTAADPASVALKLQAIAMEEMADLPAIQVRTDELIEAAQVSRIAYA